jgi:2-methylcitrate dehydratase PrpD
VSKPTLTQRLALSILSASPPTTAIGALKLCLLDFLACAFEARSLPWSRQAAEIAARSGGTASIIGGPQRAAVQAAAFANAVAGHGLVREDMHTGAVSHLGVVVLPAMLALAQRRRVSGIAFATACIIGYEVGARIGRALVTPCFVRQWRPTGFTGPLAAAAAGARLLGLSAPATASALALAANTASGLNEWPRDGGEEMFFHPGNAARNALMAVELAELGAYGSAGALDGEAGLFAATGAAADSIPDIVLFASGFAEIAAVFRKPLPVCNFAQTPTQTALRLLSEYPLTSAQIARVRIRASNAAIHYPGCDGRGPFERVLQAKMSIPFCVASALIDGAVGESSFVALNRPELLRLIAATSLEVDAAFSQAYPGRQGAEVSVVLNDGSSYDGRMIDLEAATPAMIAARFTQSADQAVGAARRKRIAQGVSSLETLDDVGALMRLTEGELSDGPDPIEYRPGS